MPMADSPVPPDNGGRRPTLTDEKGRSYRLTADGQRQYPGRPVGWTAPPWWKRRTLRFGRVSVGLEFKLADLWIGAFWKAGEVNFLSNDQQMHLWVCILPCLPLHFRWSRIVPDVY